MATVRNSEILHKSKSYLTVTDGDLAFQGFSSSRDEV